MDDTENPLLWPGPSEQLAGEGLHMGRVVNLQAHLSLHLGDKGTLDTGVSCVVCMRDRVCVLAHARVHALGCAHM